MTREAALSGRWVRAISSILQAPLLAPSRLLGASRNLGQATQYVLVVARARVSRFRAAVIVAAPRLRISSWIELLQGAEIESSFIG